MKNIVSKLNKYFVLMLVLISIIGIFAFVMLRSPFVSSYTLEAGNMIKAEDLLRKDGNAEFIDDVNQSVINHVGKHTVQVKYNDKTYKVKLVVIDTVEPEISVRPLKLYKGDVVEASMFVESIKDKTDVKITLDGHVDTSTTGEFDVIIKVEDEGNNTVIKETKLTVIEDTQLPSILVSSDIYVTLGESVSYRSFITVNDNRDGDITDYVIDSSKVDLSKTGTYPLVISANDKVGNKATKTINVYVVEYDVETVKSELEGYAKQILGHIVDSSMSVREKLEAVYDYVTDSYTYQGYHKGDIDNYYYDAYYGFKYHKGDCYVVNAMARYLLESIDIKTYGYIVKGKSDTHIFYVAYNGEDYYYYSALRRSNGVRIYEWDASEVLAYLKKWDGVTKLPELEI